MYVVLATIYSLRTPAWESNDEDSHLQYITYLRVHNGFPPIASGNGIEVHQAPLYYAVVGTWGRLLQIPAFTPELTKAPGATIESPLQVSHDYTPSQREQARWLHLLRLPSVVFGLAVVAAAFTTGLLVTGSVGCATAVGATVALWPRFLVITSAVNNDSLAFATCALALVCVLQSLRTREAWWHVGAGVFLAAAALTKQTTLPVVAVLLAVLVVSSIERRSWRGVIMTGAVLAAGSGWWYVRNLFVHGDLLASAATSRYLTEMLPPLMRPHTTLEPLVPELGRRLVTSLWFGAGWNQVTFPRPAGIALSLLAVLAAVAAVALGRQFARYLGVLLGCVAGGFVSWALIVAQTTQNEGRFLFVAITPIATLLVAGAVALANPRSSRALWAAQAFWPGLLGAVNVYVAFTWLVPYGRF